MGTKKKEINYREFIENSNDVMYAHTVNGTITFISGNIKEKLGYDPDNLINSSIYQIIHKEDINKIERITQQIATNKTKLSNIQYRLISNKGKIKWYTSNVTPILNEKDEVIHIQGIAHDISELKAKELQIKEQNIKLKELNAMKDKFISIIAHDLKNPFTNLLGFIQLLLQTHKAISKEKRNKYLNIVSDSAWQIYRLLENLLTWSRLNQNNIQISTIEVSINQVIRDAASFYQNIALQKNIKLTFQETHNEIVLADINMLQTILRNLVNNAIKFTPENGEIIIDYKKNGNNFLVISVQDNGIGIPKNKQRKLFTFQDKYIRTGSNKEEGTGMGLILCKEFVEKNKGEIWVKSTEQKGSTFYFTVPLAKKKSNQH